MNQITKDTTKEEVAQVYKHYPDTVPEGFQPFHSSRTEPIFWDIPDGVSILDVGCNSGEFMKRLLSEKKNVTVKGVDMSEDVVALARVKGLDVELGDGESLPFADASFDYVLLMEVLVHTHDPRRMLSEIKRVLKPDGVLLGSSPLKDLELHIWEEQRLHRAYYKVAELRDLLKEVFYDVHLKVLTGAQFAVGMAGSVVGDLDVEALFKCGGQNLAPWDYKLLDKSVLRAWMGPTQGVGVTYYRMTGFADKMNGLPGCDVLYDRFKYDLNGKPNDDGPPKWQDAFMRTKDNRPTNPIVVNQLEGLLKIADVSVWQITPHWSILAFFECLKEVYKKPFVTELDDWIFDLPSYNIAAYAYKPNSERERIAYRQIEISDAVIVSTEFLKESLLEIWPTKRVYVIPNGIDFSVWDAAEAKPVVKKEEGRIRIGYTGCGNHGADLQMVAAPLKAILDEFPNVEFVTAGNMARDRDGNPFAVVHERSYTLDQWVAINRWPAAVKGWQMDIGIAPLLDSNFNRAKSNLRWLEYAALGIPTVASKVRPFVESISPNVSGFLCNSKQQWYEALRDLVLNAKKRKDVGAYAYQRVKGNFNLNEIAKTYKSVLEEIKREFGTNDR